jgi:flagellar motor switch protein FliM
MMATADAPPGANAISEEEVSALLEKQGAEGVRPFDFSAQRINRTQLPMLETIAKSFAPRAAATLSGLIGRDSAVEFTSIESLRVADLQASLPAPGIVAAVRLKPLAGLAFMSVQPNLLVALLDAFFGGSGRPAPDAQAVVSTASQRFLTLLVKSVAPDFTAAWTVVSPLELELAKLETNPRLVPLGSPQDSVIVVRFTCELGAHSGTMDWMLPDAQLSPLREALAAEGGGKAPARKQEAWGPALSAGLQEVEVEIRAELGQARISLRELVSLAPGDIIPIDAPQDVTLLVGDVPLRHGRFGVSQGRNALKIIPGGSA